MDWARQIDAYCERTDLSLWAEPLNAATNAAFLIAALVMWRRVRGLALPMALVMILVVIGVGSALWHMLALGWTGALDSGSIAVFILIYLYAANRACLGWPIWAAILGTLAFLPYAGLLATGFAKLPFLASSAGYWPVPILIAGYAVFLRHRSPTTARGLGLGAAILTVSLIFRSLDAPLCTTFPVGTHFIWHLLNATMLAWMIEVLRVHLLARSGADR